MNADEIIRRYAAGERDFKKAVLERVDLHGARLSEVDLTEANLESANLSSAELRGSGMILARLAGAELNGANMSGTILALADLRKANLRNADLTGAYLMGADLSHADLTGANLTEANLAAADLTGATLAGANLGQANLEGTDLAQANLSEASVTSEQLTDANRLYEMVEGKVSIGELMRAIRGLPSDELVWTRHGYRTEKGHWLLWLSQYGGPGAYGASGGRKLHAEFAYNRIGNPHMLLWLAEAGGVDHDLVTAARRASKQSTKFPAQCGAIRRIVPWEVVAEALLNAPPSPKRKAPRPKSRGQRRQAEPDQVDHGPGRTPELPENWETLTPEQQYEWEIINRGEAGRSHARSSSRRRQATGPASAQEFRVAVWNCQMAFRKKRNQVLALEPHLLIVPECESPDRLEFPLAALQTINIIWKGANPTKGIGVFSHSTLKLSELEAHEPPFRYVVPVQVGTSPPFSLLAVWAHVDPDPGRSANYSGQVCLAIEHYSTLLQGSLLIAGDFNDNPSFEALWGGPRAITQAAESLRSVGIVSLYHTYFGEELGKESRPTFFMNRKRDKAYHVDYCFASADLAARLKSVWVGSYEEWHAVSDHVPLIFTFAA